MKKQLTKCVIALAIGGYFPLTASPLPISKKDFSQVKQLTVAPKEVAATSAQCGSVSNVIVITVVNCNELATSNVVKDEKVIK